MTSVHESEQRSVDGSSLPNLVVIGAMKAGTTSLHHYLDCHPDISMSRVKETNFFSNEKYWSKGRAWYQSQFATGTKFRGETSTSYTAYPQAAHVPQRMHEYVPDAKLVYLVRNPVTRFLSHYVHWTSIGLETRTIDEVIAAVAEGERGPYVLQGMYATQIDQYLEYFRADQLLVITTESLKQQQRETLREVCQFLGLTDDFLGTDLAREFNDSSERFEKTWWGKRIYPRWLETHPLLPWKVKAPFRRLAQLNARPISRPQPSDDQLVALTAVFADDVARLREFTGKAFPEWAHF